MPADFRNVNLEALKPWADQLACPACLGTLRLDAKHIVCSRCGRVYPVENDIPALIVERGIQAQ